MAVRHTTGLAPGEGPGALWKAVNRLLAQRIRDGVYGLGERLPTEIELAKELRVSRNTVREALDHLAERGLVMRRRRSGTTVIGTDQSRELYRYSIDPLAALDGMTKATRLQLASHDLGPLPSAIRTAHPAAEPGDWLHLEVVRVARADGSPLSWSDVYLHPRLAELRALVEESDLSIYRLIEKKAGEVLSRIDNTIKPVLVSKRIADALGVKPKSLGLHLSRRVFGAAGELLEVAEAVYPQERSQIEISFEMRGTEPEAR